MLLLLQQVKGESWFFIDASPHAGTAPRDFLAE